MPSAAKLQRYPLRRAPLPVRVVPPLRLVVASTPAPTFRGDNARAQTITDRAWILAGPSETGKTWATLWRLDQEAQRHPGSQWALVRKVRSSMDSTVLVTWRRVIAASGSGAEPFGGEKPQWYDYPNGARVYIGGMDAPQKILSGERDGVYVNQAEDLTQDDWETLSTRVTGRGAVTATPMLWGDCNPGPRDHWIMKAATAGRLTMLHSRHENNPSLYTASGQLTAQGMRTMATLDALTGVRYLRLRKGEWVGAEGQFFEEWDEKLHVVAPFAIPRDARIWAAFDYGFAHYTAFVIGAALDGMTYTIGEHAGRRMLPTLHGPAMVALCDRLGVRPDALTVYAGHDCFVNRGDTSGQTIAQQYAGYGFRFVPATIDRVNGAARMLAALGKHEMGIAPTWQVFRTCPMTIATIPAMVVDPHRLEDVKKVDTDANGGGGDDAYDANRYLLMGETPPRPSVPTSAAWGSY